MSFRLPEIGSEIVADELPFDKNYDHRGKYSLHYEFAIFVFHFPKKLLPRDD